MKIKLIDKYKSLKNFESEELPDFTVITGKNGSGKTQLLELIKDANNPQQNLIKLIPKQKNLIQFEGIEANGFYTIGQRTWNFHANKLSESWRQLDQKTKLYFCSLINFGYELEDLNNKDRIKDIYEKLEQNKVVQSHPKGTFSWTNEIGDNRHFNTLDEVSDFILKQNYSERYQRIFDFAKELSIYFHLNAEDIEPHHFLRMPIKPIYIDQTDLFGSNFLDICYIHAANAYKNSERFFSKEKRNEQNMSVNEETYSELFDSPWDLFNDIASDFEFNYQIKLISDHFEPDLSFGLKLINTSLKEEVKVESLSAGEKVIFGLVMKLFTSSYYGNKITYPSLVILDEPDAHLHPEMTQILIDVLNKTFVGKLGIRVIITTHSPITVALSPDESIFEINNTSNCSLGKIGRDKALELLTDPIPTLNIDYKNHKQVFVESNTDGNYFRKIYETLKRHQHELKSPLYFIDNPMGKGNSDVVKNIVTQFHKSDNKKIFGIIDWDQNNISSEFIYVHGEEKRHTIENYLLDPIYVAILFLKRDGCHNIYETTGFNSEMNEYSLIEKEEKVLQEISLNILKPIEKQFNLFKNNELIAIEYFDGKKINLPYWFLHMKHEELVEKFSITYKSISNYKKKGEGKLQEELTKIICKSYPMIPKDTVDLLTHISNS